MNYENRRITEVGMRWLREFNCIICSATYRPCNGQPDGWREYILNEGVVHICKLCMKDVISEYDNEYLEVEL